MPYVVQQCSGNYFPFCLLVSLHFFDEQAGDVHNAEAVLESRVVCSGINEICKTELTYSSEPLNDGCVDDFHDPVFYLYRSVDGVSDRLFFHELWMTGFYLSFLITWGG